jgi:hypothetical protein
MIRRLSGVALVALCLLPVRGWSHAVVKHASLRDAPVVAGTATQVTLEFNSAIEASLAKVTLADERGAERPLALVAGTHPKNTLVVALPPLAAGHYALRYKVLAADGHVTESVLRFEAAARP